MRTDSLRLPGAWRSAWRIARKDLRLEGTTFERPLAMMAFALVALVLFGFALDPASLKRPQGTGTLAGLLWLVFCFAGLVGFARAFHAEHRREAWVVLRASPAGSGAIFVGKTLANWLLLLLLETLVIPLAVIWFEVPLPPFGSLVVVLSLHSLGLAELGTLLGAMVSRLERGEALLATLLLPLATPLVLSAVHTTRGLAEARSWQGLGHWLAIASGLDLLYFLLALVLFDFVLEE